MKYISTTKSNKIEKVKHMLYIRENKHTQRNLVGKTKGNRKLGRPQENRKIILFKQTLEIGYSHLG